MKHLTFGLSALLLIAGCSHAPKATDVAPSPDRAPQSTRETFYQAEHLFVPISQGKMLEGPAADKDGRVYVSNVGKRGTIGVWNPGDLAPTPWLTLPDGGASAATRMGPDGRLWIADYRKHRLYSVALGGNELRLEFEGPELNQPNDFTFAQDGTIYLSDPSWSSKKKGRIYKWDRNQGLQLLVDDVRAANGIDLLPQEKALVYSESISGRLMKVELPDGKPQMLFKFEPDTVDGLRVDQEGRIYVTRITKGRIDVISPQGERLHSIELQGKEPTNLNFGGPDGRTMYVTLRDLDAIEIFRVPHGPRE